MPRRKRFVTTHVSYRRPPSVYVGHARWLLSRPGRLGIILTTHAGKGSAQKASEALLQIGCILQQLDPRLLTDVSEVSSADGTQSLTLRLSFGKEDGTGLPPSKLWGTRATFSGKLLERVLHSLRQQDLKQQQQQQQPTTAKGEEVDNTDVAEGEIICARAWDYSQVFMGPVDKPNAAYRKVFNDLPGRVCPTPEEDAAASAAVDKVVKLLQQQLPKHSRVDRVHVGGSFGRRTSVRGRFDVDLLVFVNGLDTGDKQQAELLLHKAKAALEAGGVCDGPAKLRPELDMLKLVSQGVEMDVLLVRNVAEGARQGVDRAQVQRDLLVGPLFHMTDDEIAAMAQQTPDRAQERGVVEALTRFVREQHTTANQAVRLFKAWVKVGLAEAGQLTSSKLPSVVLELITLQAFAVESAAAPADLAVPAASKTLLLRTFLRSLHLAGNLLGGAQGRPPLVMLDAGQHVGYRRAAGMRFAACWGPPPHIIHPIDPTCNVARVPEEHAHKPPWDWKGLAREARKVLEVVLHGSMQELMEESSLGTALRALE